MNLGIPIMFKIVNIIGIPNCTQLFNGLVRNNGLVMTL